MLNLETNTVSDKVSDKIISFYSINIQSLISGMEDNDQKLIVSSLENLINIYPFRHISERPEEIKTGLDYLRDNFKGSYYSALYSLAKKRNLID